MEQALYTYQKSILSAMNDVENSFSAYTNQKDTVNALERTVQAARKASKLSLELYRQGLSNFQNVLDAQKTLFDYDTQLALAKGNTINYLVGMYKALGGGWTPVKTKTDVQEVKKPDAKRQAEKRPVRIQQVSLR